MAGEIEEPIRLDFQADSFSSGSISFGRFESEALCWERRSSFSHNRYLEEVEKCSKPGLVIEKKAYFEAQFRKKGTLGLTSPENQNQTEYQYDISEKTGCDEINHVNGESNSPCFDESPGGSVCGSEDQVIIEQEREISDKSSCEAQNNLLCDSVDNEKLDLCSTHSGSEVEVKTENVTTDLFSHSHATADASPKTEQVLSSKENNSSQAEYMMKPRLAPRVDAAQGDSYISMKASKSSDNKAIKIVNKVSMRSKAEKPFSEAAAQNKRTLNKTPKHEPVSKSRGANAINRDEEKPRNRVIGKGLPSLSQKFPSRVHQSENRIKPPVRTTRPCINQDGSRFSFKCNERAERRKMFDMKVEERIRAKEAEKHQLQEKVQEKTEAQLKLLQKSLNFKAKPLPSFYRGDLRESDTNKAKASKVNPRKLQTKSSNAGRVSESSLNSAAGKKRDILVNSPPRTTDPPLASGATSCHSTVTSDSTPSSPAAEIIKGHSSQMAINSRVGGNRENDKDKRSTLHKHKVAQGQGKPNGLESKRK